VNTADAIVGVLLLTSVFATGVGRASDLGAKTTVGTPASGPVSAEPASVVVRIEDPCVRGFRVNLAAAGATRLSLLGPNGTVLDRRSIRSDTSTYWRNVTTDEPLVTNRTYRIVVDADGEEFSPRYSPRKGFPSHTDHFSVLRGYWDGAERVHAYGVFGLVALVEECASDVPSPEELPVITPRPTPSPAPEPADHMTIARVSPANDELDSSEFPLLLVPLALLIVTRL
jgi:hypothetical protein